MIKIVVLRGRNIWKCNNATNSLSFTTSLGTKGTKSLVMLIALTYLIAYTFHCPLCCHFDQETTKNDIKMTAFWL